MKIKLTLNELIYLAHKQLGLECIYRNDSNLLLTQHIIEVIDVQPKLEEGTG